MRILLVSIPAPYGIEGGMTKFSALAPDALASVLPRVKNDTETTQEEVYPSQPGIPHVVQAIMWKLQEQLDISNPEETTPDAIILLTPDAEYAVEVAGSVARAMDGALPKTMAFLQCNPERTLPFTFMVSGPVSDYWSPSAAETFRP